MDPSQLHCGGADPAIDNNVVLASGVLGCVRTRDLVMLDAVCKLMKLAVSFL